MNKMNKYRELESWEYPVEVYISEDIELDKYKNKNYYIGDIGGVVYYKKTITNLHTGEQEEIEDDCDIDATYPNKLEGYDIKEFEKDGINVLTRSVLFDVEYTENPKEYVKANEIKIYINKIEVRQRGL